MAQIAGLTLLRRALAFGSDFSRMRGDMGMWNQLRTDAYAGMLAETVSIAGQQGDPIHA